MKARLQEEEIARLKRRTEALEDSIVGVSRTFYRDGLTAARDAIGALVKQEDGKRRQARRAEKG